ncbi:predicted protein [Sclerotinia sclerotiorum 1980 UF-70]|uniref:Uncharacterized protein n=1 Tax=Sclerotinia sclerotiorum (strain ATCC 18683 / 1980 / Ss-1) TaxID=665079 RepID=A7EH01_SCLS1|nr:predicted protein [Sclerotinia sclerotiorum 1980 UF-70]EDO02117.1 predicted protein [Sclerotinia sclerotiorum 1980 UF-70]
MAYTSLQILKSIQYFKATNEVSKIFPRVLKISSCTNGLRT